MIEKPIRLLIVEDDKEDYLILRKMLAAVKRHRFELDYVSTYVEAIEKLGQNAHDICLLDYRLEGRNGLDFLREAIQKGNSIPIIFLTGQGDYEVDLEAMQLGASDFLYKNKIDGQTLEKSIRYALERRKAEENRMRLSFIVESSNDAIYTVTLEGVVLSWNPGARNIYGYLPEEVGGRDISILVPEGRKGEFHGLLERVKGGEALGNFTTLHRAKGGKEILLSICLSPIKDALGHVTRVSIIARDITESENSKAVKGMLQAERDELLRRLQLQMERMPVACLLADQNYHFTYWNPAAENLFGYSFKEVEGKEPKGVIVSPASWPSTESIFKRIAQGDMTAQGIYSENIRKNGKTLICEWYNTPLIDVEGNFNGIMSMAIDVTERKKSEEVQAQLAAILQQTSDAVVGTDLEGNIFSWNRGAEVLFGYNLDEIIGRPITICSPPDRGHETMELCAIVKGGENISNFETVRVGKDGGLIDVSVTMSPVKDLGGRIIGTSSIHRDITEKKQAEASLRRHEEQLRQVEKMNAIGRLAGGVAHDFNNLLSVIGGNAEFLISGLEEKDPKRDELTEIQKAVKRGAELTKQLLVFGQKQVSQPQPVNLNELSAEMNKMLKRILDANVDLAIIQDKELRPILADPGQVQQVILNLVLNARDAMPKGGSLIVETKQVKEGELEGEERPSLPPGDYARLSVTDTGTGMTPEIQKHIFEPFFTTKAGKGTGLGLATVYGLVRKWSGHIFVHSTPGMGTTFTLYFPSLSAAPAMVAKPRQIDLIPQGSETVLVSEDEGPVRRVLVRTLEKYGYRVLEAENGLQALQKAWGYREPIQLLLTDTVMPKMNGKELADELKKTRPEIKVVFISGYPKEILSQQGVLDAGLHLIQKPFELEDLARQVRKVLDEK